MKIDEAQRGAKAEVLATHDADGEFWCLVRTLSAEAQTAGHEAREAEQLRTRFDADGDGELSDTERETPNTELADNGRRKERGSRRGPDTHEPTDVDLPR
jgi:hypothetical protein